MLDTKLGRADPFMVEFLKAESFLVTGTSYYDYASMF